MLDKEQKKKLLDKVLNESFTVILLLLLTGVLGYRQYNTELKMEQKLDKMEVQVDSLILENYRLRNENSQCLKRVDNLTDIIEEVTKSPKKRILEKIKIN